MNTILKIGALAVVALSATLSRANEQRGDGIVPRLPISCSYEEGTTHGYEIFTFSGYLNRKSQSIELAYNISDEHGVDIDNGARQTLYKIVNDQLLVNLSTQNPKSVLKISADILWSTKDVAASYAGRTLQCAIFHTQLSNYFLSHRIFDQINLPQTDDSNPEIKVKSWTSSDGKLSITATSYPDSKATRHNRSLPGSTDIKVVIGGEVVDSQTDDAGHIFYLLYGNDPKKEVQARITHVVDVNQIKNIFGKDRVSLDLTHPYGHTSPVNVEIDCSSNQECIVTAKN